MPDDDGVTNCELCSRVISSDDVRMCDECGLDGLCADCLKSHDCEA